VADAIAASNRDTQKTINVAFQCARHAGLNAKHRKRRPTKH
jgi:hypothetical protein